MTKLMNLVMDRLRRLPEAKQDQVASEVEELLEEAGQHREGTANPGLQAALKEGLLAPSKITKSVEQQAVAAKLTEGFSHAGYSKTTIADQAARATDYINSNFDRSTSKEPKRSTPASSATKPMPRSTVPKHSDHLKTTQAMVKGLNRAQKGERPMTLP